MVKFHGFKRFHRNPVIGHLYNQRLRHILSILADPTDGDSTVLDVACSTGYFSVISSAKAKTVGLDTDRKRLVKGRALYSKFRSKGIDFVNAHPRRLPFRNVCMDVIVCASVLEHIGDVSEPVRQSKDVMKQNGILIAGYPIETRLSREA